MKPGQEAQRAHDALVELAPKGSHAHCDLCPDPIKKEVAQVSDTDRTYTADEHLALMADAVTRETAALTEAKEGAETKITELAAQVDVLAAEKAALNTELETAKAEHDKYVADIERLAAIEAAKAQRVEAVKAARAGLPEDYFTDERVQRWAEMDEATFASFIEDITGVPAEPVKETAAFGGGDSPTSSTKTTVGSLFAARRGEKN